MNSLFKNIFAYSFLKVNIILEVCTCFVIINYFKTLFFKGFNSQHYIFIIIIIIINQQFKYFNIL